jgi:hypothetical protein
MYEQLHHPIGLIERMNALKEMLLIGTKSVWWEVALGKSLIERKIPSLTVSRRMRKMRIEWTMLDEIVWVMQRSERKRVG